MGEDEVESFDLTFPRSRKVLELLVARLANNITSNHRCIATRPIVSVPVETS